MLRCAAASATSAAFRIRAARSVTIARSVSSEVTDRAATEHRRRRPAPPPFHRPRPLREYKPSASWSPGEVSIYMRWKKAQQLEDHVVYSADAVAAGTGSGDKKKYWLSVRDIPESSNLDDLLDVLPDVERGAAASDRMIAKGIAEAHPHVYTDTLLQQGWHLRAASRRAALTIIRAARAWALDPLAHHPSVRPMSRQPMEAAVAGRKNIRVPSDGTLLRLKVYLPAYSGAREYLSAAREALAGFGIDDRTNKGGVDVIGPRNDFRVVLVRMRCAAEARRAERELAIRAIKTRTVVRAVWRYPEGFVGSDDVQLDPEAVHQDPEGCVGSDDIDLDPKTVTQES
mmetsp:Transcript_44196/g.86731  ORF Transcript_44196/g.86731 Transcript_44196/m.86731 type:complete len:343 (+) Transcript_44196:105-1133(+)|eukprot:CAMPEP_0194306204 /NCGR_PEP_ID=MMETSP0171-20130528/3440_1 /TAXON_ID=218684 /ORGANISM="Corethron pennatum, Strain L29A3" /LENGTH=342 /DNA_ID=CAMNT_0039057941 /DNA_START=42 /DNA_END=1070 /DNA_ORIENTATION=+